MGIEIIEAGHIVSTVLVRFAEFPHILGMRVRNQDMEGLEEEVKRYLPVRIAVPGGGVITKVLKPARPARWLFASTEIYDKDDAALLENATGKKPVFESVKIEHTVWIAHGHEFATKDEAVRCVKRASSVNSLIKTQW